MKGFIVALLLVVLASPAEAGKCVAPPSGLVSWWPGDGNGHDIAGAHPGTLEGGVWFGSGKVAQAFSFDGFTGRVRIPSGSSLNPAGSLTLDAWIFPTADSFGHIVVKWGDTDAWANQRAYSFHTLRGGGLRFAISDNAHQSDGAFHTFDAPSVLTLNAWNFVAAVYDQSTGTRRLYVNGVQVATRTDSPITLTASIADLGIGAQLKAPGIFDLPFQGFIDEVEIYNRSLTSAEIQAIFNAGSAGKCNQPPVADPGVDQTEECIGPQTPITLDASGSSDPENDALTFQWFAGTTSLGTDPSLLVPFGVGSHTIELVVTDQRGSEDHALVNIDITDTTRPLLVIPPDQTAFTGSDTTECEAVVPDAQLGTANGSDTCSEVTITRADIFPGNIFPVGTTSIQHTATDASGNSMTELQDVVVIDDTPPDLLVPDDVVAGNDPRQCSASLTLPAAIGSDNCALDEVTGTRSDGKPLTDPYPVGTTTISWMATDWKDNQSSGVQTVAIYDVEAPSITNLSATPSALWPPKRKMIDVAVNYEVWDNCLVGDVTLSIASNEPVTGHGDNTSPDFEVVDLHHVRLRAEQQPAGSGRVYTITIRANDIHGNSASQRLEVRVTN